MLRDESALKSYPVVNNIGFSFRRIKTVFLLTGLFYLTACGTSLRSAQNSDPEIQLEAAPIESELAGDPVPFQINVVDEVNDGHYLYLKIRLEAALDWDLSKLVVSFSGVDRDKIVRSEHYIAAQIQERTAGSEKSVSEIIKGGESCELSLVSPVESLTSYQLELLWGNDAKPYLIKLAKANSSGLLLKNTEIREKYNCVKSPCSIYYTLFSDLLNNTPQTVEEVELAVGFVWRAKVQTGAETGAARKLDSLPKSEDTISVSNLNLTPGSSKQLKIDLAEPVIESKQGRYLPVIRVVNYN